jgi:aryl-alcohol dehydrogenase-like predicted oxidoreductase
MEGLRTAKEKGKLRFIGVSNFSVDQMDRVREVAPLDAHQTGYNLFWRKPEDAIIPYCRKNGIPVVTYSSIAQGIMTGKFPRNLSFSRDDPRTGIVFFRDEVWPHIYEAVDDLKPLAAESGRSLVELAIRWVLSHNGVTTAVVGARNVDQLRANVAALEGEIGEEIFRRMTEISDRVQPYFPDIPNMYDHRP